jgi:uncharacterized membrane protein
MFIKLYFIALPIFFGLDILWLGIFAKKFYAKQLGPLMKAKVGWPAAVLFYLLYIAGLVTLVIFPAITYELLNRAVVFGAVFGLCCYATYDLTNLATLKGWPIALTVVDLIWGTILTASVSAATYLIAVHL